MGANSPTHIPDFVGNIGNCASCSAHLLHRSLLLCYGPRCLQSLGLAISGSDPCRQMRLHPKRGSRRLRWSVGARPLSAASLNCRMHACAGYLIGVAGHALEKNTKDLLYALVVRRMHDVAWPAWDLMIRVHLYALSW